MFLILLVLFFLSLFFVVCGFIVFLMGCVYLLVDLVLFILGLLGVEFVVFCWCYF